MKIAVIGAGISGAGAALLLDKAHDVTIYERETRLGGHSRTVDVSTEDGAVAVDTGFIVFNHRNYPLLTSLFDLLGVETAPASMSFGVSMRGVTEYGSETLSGLFAMKRNLLRPSHWSMIFDILAFNKRAARFLNADPEMTLSAAVKEMGLGSAFRDRYLMPMGGAIWSCTPDEAADFPAAAFIRFFENHGLLTVNDQPQWYSVAGGSREYVKKLNARMRGVPYTGTPAVRVRREGGAVFVRDGTGSELRYDCAVLACHADEALTMIEAPTEKERAVLGAFRYSVNDIVLHTDASFMPRRRKARSSWVYLSEGTGKEPKISLTYWMNNLQKLSTQTQIFVTLNPARDPAAGTVHDRHTFRHPIYDANMMRAQSRLPELQGEGGLYFCGAYHRYGFHEDGLASGVAVAEALGAERIF